jgi:galactokinase
MAVPSKLVSEAVETFRQKYLRPPKWIVAAPGRVNLIGEHVDYNDGFVLPMAIERHVVIAADIAEVKLEAANHKSAAAYSVGLDESIELSLDPKPPSAEMQWGNYMEGVVAGFRKLNHQVPPFDAVVHSDVPLGGGLSSSAALEVATATLIEAMLQIELLLVEKALLCQHAEHEFANVPCGIMDQFSSVLCQQDHLLLLDCRSHCFEQIRFSNPDISVLITNSEVKHELSTGEYAVRRSQCAAAARALGLDSLRDCSWERLKNGQAELDSILFRRARHVVSETERTIAAAKASQAGNWSEFGRLMYASHTSLRDDFEVSCCELDTLVEIAGDLNGVIGSRMTGGGFGGCTVSLVQTELLEAVMKQLKNEYWAKTGIEATLFSTRPAQGAHVVSSSPAIGNS